MPIPTLHDIRKHLQSPPHGLPKPALVDVTAPSHPAVALTFQITGHPQILTSIGEKVRQYRQWCEAVGRMEQIAFELKSENVAHLMLYSPHASMRGTPYFLQRLFGVKASEPRPYEPADLTSMRKALLGKP